MATTKHCIKAIFYGNKENQLKSSNLVTMATYNICKGHFLIRKGQQQQFLENYPKIRKKRSHFDANKESSIEYIGFGNIISDNCGFNGNKIT